MLKAKCLRTVNVLKYLSHPRTGCNRKILLQIYKSLVQSHLDYGAPIYNLANKSSLSLLDPIHSSCLRLALGAFRTSPSASLCAEAAEPPLGYRRLFLTANFLTTTSRFPHLPPYQNLLHPSNIPPQNYNKHIRLFLQQSLSRPLKLNPLPPIHLTTPPWLLPLPTIRLDITKIPKSNSIVYKTHIRKLISEFPNHVLCFTDGSKCKERTAYAYSIAGQVTARRIRNSASIYTAELNAILSCIIKLSHMPPGHFLLLTDSLSSLISLQNPFSSHPLIQRLHLSLLSLSESNSSITLCWIPGHIGLPGHDAVDRAAKQATLLTKITDPIQTPALDLKSHYQYLINNVWYKNWKNIQNNKLRKIKHTPTLWSTSSRDTRREEALLARLRIGHTALTHNYLLLNLYGPPPALTAIWKTLPWNTSFLALPFNSSGTPSPSPPLSPQPYPTTINLHQTPSFISDRPSSTPYNISPLSPPS